jgi:AcrR family transcriptional regulator
MTQKAPYHHGALRNALIDAASEVLREIGPKGMTIREVANRVGVSHAAPYRHFRDKDELAVAVVERGFTLLNEAMSKARAAAGEDLLQQFTASGEAYMNFARNYPAYYRAMFSGELLSAEDKAGMEHTSAESLAEIEGYVRACQDMGVLRKEDAKLQSIAIVSAIHGFLSLLNDGRIAHLLTDRYSVEQAQEFVIGAVIRGVGEPQD